MKVLRRTGAGVLTLVLIGIVLAWDLLSVYAPAVMGRPLWPGGAAPVGILWAFLIIVLIMVVALLYGRAGGREPPRVP